jgi:hypothetical protein
MACLFGSLVVGNRESGEIVDWVERSETQRSTNVGFGLIIANQSDLILRPIFNR